MNPPKNTKKIKQPNHLLDRIARILTNVFNPLVSLIAITLILYQKTAPQNTQTFLLWTGVILLNSLLGILVLAIAKKKGLISNWDITNRAERPRVFAIFFVLIVLINLIFLVLGYKQTAKYLLTVTAGFSAAFGITNFWKISIHTFAIGLAVSVFIHFFPGSINQISLILPILVAWTRIRLKRHTLEQTIGGIMLAASVYIYLQIFFR